MKSQHDLDLWAKANILNKVQTITVSKHFFFFLIKIDASVRLEICLLIDKHTHRQTHIKTHRQTLMRIQKAFRERRHLHVCDLWPWVVTLTLCQDYVIRCRLLYCSLVPGMMSVSVIVCEIWPLVYFHDLWPSPVTFIVHQGHCHCYH